MMTENHWQNATPQGVPAGQNTAGTGTGTSSDAAAMAESKATAAKDETAGVARHAAGAAQDIAETAKNEVAHVASEVKSGAMDLLHQAKSDVTAQAETAQQKAAEGIRKISEELRTMAGASEESGVATDLVRQAADRSASIASWLENRNPGSLLEEAKTFARQRPGAFLLLAAGTGMLAGRLGKSLQAGAPTTATTSGTVVPPQPAQSPTERNITAGIGAPFYEETTVAAPVYGETGYRESSQAGLADSGTAGGRPSGTTDPFVQGGGSQL